MLICQEENCTCMHHRMLYYLKKGSNGEAKSILQYLENLSGLVDSSGRTLLHYSVDYENEEMMQYLIDEGCLVNAQDASGVTPLMLAVKGPSRCKKIVKILLKNNADVCIADNDGTSSLESAFYEPLTNYRSYYAINVEQDDYRILERLFDKVNNDFSKGELEQKLSNASTLVKLMVVAFGNGEISRFVLENGYSIDFREPKYDYTALHCALFLARLENVKILMEHGANVDVLRELDGSFIYNYVLNFEAVDEDSELLTSLLKYSSSLSTPDQSCSGSVEWLLTNGKKKTVRALLLSGIDVEACLTEGQTLLTCLIRNNKDEEVLDVFDELEVKFDSNEHTSNGNTALVEAVRLRYPGKVEFLLQHGADVNMATSDGVTALSLINITLICQRDYNQESETAKITELLLQYGARDAQSLLGDEQNLSGKFSCAIRVIIGHLALLEAQDQSSLSDLSRTRIAAMLPLKTYFDLCKRQIEEMKGFELHGTVTLFKLLTESDEQKIVAYARNKELKLALISALWNLSHLEPYYLHFLRRRISRGLVLAELQNKAALVIETLTGISSDVYHAIILKIISFLEPQDLSNLCDI